MDSTSMLQAGNGFRLQVDRGYITWLKNTMFVLEALWEQVKTPQEFFDHLPWTDHQNDKYGNRKWVAYKYNDEDELRISVVLNANGTISIDYREFFVNHSSGTRRRTYGRR